jgi:ribose transport system ATP-binding protein
MAGRELKEIFPIRSAQIGTEKLRVENLSLKGKFKGINFTLRAGEVVGIAGLAGAGRTELVESIFGTNPAHRGEIFLNERKINSVHPNRSVARGIGLLTEDRKKTGLCLNLPMSQNLTLSNVRSLIDKFWLSRTRELNSTREYIEKLHIRPAAPEKKAALMSGGNQQKVLLARWLFAGCEIFLLDEPTRGVDVGARAEIYQLINELAESGAAILVVSSDLPELLGITDRILVMRRGRLAAELITAQTTQEEIMRYAAIETFETAEQGAIQL